MTPNIIIEPLLDPKNRRYNLLPLAYPLIYNMYKKHRDLFWIPQEINLSKDLNDWYLKLNDEERYFIKLILSFFAASDFIVNENIAIDSDDITVIEYKMFLNDKAAREDIHSQMYALLIETYVDSDEEKNRLLKGVSDIPVIKHKIEWFRKYFTKSFQHRIVATAITEGIFFSSSFCAIFWLKKRGLMPGLCDSNEAISREEGLHYTGACVIYTEYIVNKLDPEEIKEMITEAVNVELEFVKYILPQPLQGINADNMSQYVRYVADIASVALIGKRIYGDESPFEWMGLISQYTKANFFENRPTSYAKYGSKDEKLMINFDLI